jgi:hypothetical protein
MTDYKIAVFTADADDPFRWNQQFSWQFSSGLPLEGIGAEINALVEWHLLKSGN